MRDDEFGWMRGGGLGDVPAKAGWCIQDMAGFLIELRSRGRTEQLESKLRHITKGWVSHAEDFTPASTVADTQPFRSTRLCCLGRSGWASGRTDVCALASFLSTIFATPPATDVISTDDEMGLGSSLDAAGAAADGHGADATASEQLWGEGSRGVWLLCRFGFCDGSFKLDVYGVRLCAALVSCTIQEGLFPALQTLLRHFHSCYTGGPLPVKFLELGL
ncbi:hypothetical protein C8J57DRAFT_1232350 [Mycena rebaudengoi]|nr:hypothetical protein C8J57DRAFT_1232350 [Mycena rebaudengoi]